MRRQATPRNWELIIKFVRIIIPGKDEDEMPIHEFSVLEPRKEEINARCCDQLTAVKTGHPLTSVT